MTNKKNTAAKKYAAVAKDWRIASIRAATADESEGGSTAVIVTLTEGVTLAGTDLFQAYSVADVRELLDHTVSDE